jgi:hypothetical protein
VGKDLIGMNSGEEFSFGEEEIVYRAYDFLNSEKLFDFFLRVRYLRNIQKCFKTIFCKDELLKVFIIYGVSLE